MILSASIRTKLSLSHMDARKVQEKITKGGKSRKYLLCKNKNKSKNDTMFKKSDKSGLGKENFTNRR